ncbi:fibrocystin-L-like [Clavelina lepadiformis]|uniref:fibrocystin-L-like n=1 Tax=Clavelina lepadiformis TaxID=159417 RepID=UPI0040431C1F
MTTVCTSDVAHISPGIEITTTTTASDFAFDIGDLVPAADILSEIEDFQSASTTSASTTSVSTTSASTTSTGIELTTTTASDFAFDIGDLVPAADILSEIEDFQSASTTSASTTSASTTSASTTSASTTSASTTSASTTSASTTSTGIELTTTTASDFAFDIGDLVPAAASVNKRSILSEIEDFQSASTTSASTTSASTTSASTTSASTTSASTTSTGIELTTITETDFGFEIEDLVPGAASDNEGSILSEIEHFLSASTTSVSTASTSASTTSVSTESTSASTTSVSTESTSASTTSTVSDDVNVAGQVESITPTNGSLGGCNKVEISGSEFNSTLQVKIGGNPCSVTNYTHSRITCTTSAASSTGTVDVEVTTSGSTLVLSNAYTYENSSAITNLSLDKFTVNGGTNVTITGTGFSNTSGQVFIGDEEANILVWNDTSIEISTPSIAAGSYKLKVVLNGSVGCAAGSRNVTYEFSVSSITPDKGSLAGGTTVTLTGSGFTNDSLVKLGDVTCDDVTVTDSGTSLTCVTKPPGKVHVVTNAGLHPKFGKGYSWNSSTVEMEVGGLLSVRWSISSLIDDAKIGLYSTDSASNKTYNDNGFNIARVSKGKHQYRFNQEGKFYFISNCVDKACQIFLGLTVEVNSAINKVGTAFVTLANRTASGSFDFTFDIDETPMVTRISPNTGTTATIITINGTGFSTSTTVKVGGKSCDVIGITTNATITCQISASEELAVGIYHPVVVNVDGKGDALLQMQSQKKRSFALTPLITRISPNMGSLAGGTKITIQGSGFTNKSNVIIAKQQVPCDVIDDESTYTSLVCITRASTAASGNISVTVGSTAAECFGNDCFFEFATNATPVVAEQTTDNDFSALTITLTGIKFGTNASAINITLSSGGIITSCNVTSAADTQIQCDLVSRLPVGENTVSVSISGAKGLASFSIKSHQSVDSPAYISASTPTLGSTAGGTTLSITGNGFVKDDVTVQVGGVPCVITNVTLSKITCTTGARVAGPVSVEVVSNGVMYPIVSYEYSNAATPTIANVSPATGAEGDSITLTGTKLGNVTSDLTVTVGGIDCNVTSVSNTSLECTLGAREGGPVSIEVTAASFGRATVNLSISFRYILAVDDFSPKTGSYGGSQLVTIDGAGFSDHTIVHICDLPCTLENSSSTQITCRTSANPNYVDSSSSTTCEVKVTNEAQIEDFAITAGSNYTYSGAQTPTITGVTPERGGTGGGTEITINGSGFTLDSDLTVTIDGSDCVISTSSDTSIECQTASHKGSIKTKVTVRVGNLGIATQDGADFFYIDRWSSVFTWGGDSLPTDEDFVIIKMGQTVLLDTHTAILKMLLIDGGELIFDEAEDANVSLRAENILIVNNGRLQVGTEAEPYKGKAEIVMYGQLRSKELPIYGEKTLGLRSGTLDLHGRHIPNPWTVLAATADVGATQITLKLPAINWQAGDEVVIASTGTRHSQKENEKRKISAISSDLLTITFDSALEYKHLGVTEVLDDRTEVELRAEVGLLSRNVVFRGTNDVAWNDEIEACEAGFQTGQFATQTCFQGRFGEEAGSDQFGGSIMIHSSEPNSGEVEARIENIEVTYVGQAFRLGRYPIHFHLMGDVSGMYVKRCAIHNTFNRAVTIHGTHHLLVDSNVVYNVMGGAFFIEDGIETGNVIQHNLAVFVRQSTSLLIDDITPAAYWVSNPNNTLRHNHAAGGTHFGFWYRMHEHPDGPSYTPTVCQQKVELGEFRNNTVHSQGWFGLWIFQTYFPMKGSR